MIQRYFTGFGEFPDGETADTPDRNDLKALSLLHDITPADLGFTNLAPPAIQSNDNANRSIIFGFAVYIPPLADIGDGAAVEFAEIRFSIREGTSTPSIWPTFRATRTAGNIRLWGQLIGFDISVPSPDDTAGQWVYIEFGVSRAVEDVGHPGLYCSLNGGEVVPITGIQNPAPGGPFTRSDATGLESVRFLSGAGGILIDDFYSIFKTPDADDAFGPIPFLGPQAVRGITLDLAAVNPLTGISEWTNPTADTDSAVLANAQAGDLRSGVAGNKILAPFDVAGMSGGVERATFSLEARAAALGATLEVIIERNGVIHVIDTIPLILSPEFTRYNYDLKEAFASLPGAPVLDVAALAANRFGVRIPL